MLALLGTLIGAGSALAQGAYSPNAPPPGAPAQNPVCVRLEAQLAAVDRGAVDPARADQIKRYEDAAARQQADLDRTLAQSRRLGCEGLGFFSIFGGQNPQCPQINQHIQQIRGNLDRTLSDLQRIQGGGGDREAQRQNVIAALAQNNCGPQYRAVANQQRGFFETLFGGGNQSSSGGYISTPEEQPMTGGGYRTLCVRTCDGYYYPISYSTSPAKFHDDEITCQQTCPASEVVLMTYRNPGEDINRAVSSTGRLYTSLPNAFKYRTEFNPSCSCRRPGQSWAEALSQVRDTTIERGDIVVTEERAKALSQPRDAQGRPVRPDAKKPDAQAATGPDAPAGDAAAPKRAVRSVGPTFVPAR
jgi:hypothetical protein